MQQSTGVVEIFLMFVGVGGLVVSALIAMPVYHDADRRFASRQKLWFFGPKLWLFSTFIGGITTAAIYWVMHYSTLAPPEASGSGDQ